MSESNEATLNEKTIAAWEEYCRTGKSVPNDVVMTWLDSWGTENESAFPEF